MTPLLALQSHYLSLSLTGRLRLKSSSKCLLIDLDTPLSPQNIRGLVLEGFNDGSQNAVWRSEVLSASLQNYENRSK